MTPGREASSTRNPPIQQQSLIIISLNWTQQDLGSEIHASLPSLLLGAPKSAQQANRPGLLVKL
jgi:hypothetical protein